MASGMQVANDSEKKRAMIMMQCRNRRITMERIIIVKKCLHMIYPDSVVQGSATHVLRRSIAKLINRKTGRIETAQEWLGHTSAAHTRAYIDAEDYREKANGVVAALDI